MYPWKLLYIMEEDCLSSSSWSWNIKKKWLQLNNTLRYLLLAHLICKYSHDAAHFWEKTYFCIKQRLCSKSDKLLVYFWICQIRHRLQIYVQPRITNVGFKTGRPWLSEVSALTRWRMPITIWPIESCHMKQTIKCHDFLAFWWQELSDGNGNTKDKYWSRTLTMISM